MRKADGGWGVSLTSECGGEDEEDLRKGGMGGGEGAGGERRGWQQRTAITKGTPSTSRRRSQPEAREPLSH